MPAAFQPPSTAAPVASWVSGSSGRKLVEGMSPVNSGTSAITTRGVSEAMPRMRCVVAAAEAPLCCSLKVISRKAVASRKVEFTRSVRPLLTKPRSSSVSCQVLMTESAGNSALSM
ncbi:hypothetical protein D9M69_575330 [compost metagenome]